MRSGGTLLAMLSIGDRYAVRRNAARDAIDRRPLRGPGRSSKLSFLFRGRQLRFSYLPGHGAGLADRI